MVDNTKHRRKAYDIFNCNEIDNTKNNTINNKNKTINNKTTQLTARTTQLTTEQHS
jgi:hypothetical protein